LIIFIREVGKGVVILALVKTALALGVLNVVWLLSTEIYNPA